jgi:hypothetical protein
MRTLSRSQIFVVALMIGIVALVALIEWRRESRLSDLCAEVETLKKRVDARDEVEPLRSAPCPRPCVVSMAQLIAHPARYDGLEVQFSAVYAEGFELSALYPVGTVGTLREVEGIWVADASRFPRGGAIVDVGGTFRFRPSGHLEQYFAELTDVQWVDVAVEPANKRMELTR